MDLVPIMIHSMTRTATYVTEEEQQELCQIGYLALCRSAVGFEEGRSFQPYAKTIIRHAIFQGDVHRVVLALIHTNVRDIARSGEVVAVFVERNGHYAICEVEGFFDAVAVVDVDVDVHHARIHSIVSL